jgi:hypothetical protein
MLSLPGGLQLVEMFRHDEKPSLLHAADMSDVAMVLEAVSPPMATLCVVPLRAPTWLLGLVMLYYPADATLPSEALLDYLELMARSLRAPMQIAAECGIVSGGGRPRNARAV